MKGLHKKSYICKYFNLWKYNRDFDWNNFQLFFLLKIKCIQM